MTFPVSKVFRSCRPFPWLGSRTLAFYGWVVFSALFLLFHPFCLRTNAQTSKAGDTQSASAKFDDPAELPRTYVKTTFADTPAPGSVHVVKPGDDLQQAIDNVKCGETLKLQAGETFRGIFRFPKKNCDDAHWIVIRTSAPDDALPPENTILTPCYAGVASLPGRPDFHCSSTRNVLAKVELDRKVEAGPILFEDGANHYRFIGLEVTRNVPGLHMRNMVQPEKPEYTASHLIFDRLWIHGSAQDETKGGIHLSGTTDVGIVDSFFTDFHCIARGGSCTDSQAINGGTADSQSGPYKILNNFLEASGEAIMFGGGPGSTTPADIEIRHNHLFKPLLWRPGQPGFVGAADGNPFIVKNCLELKNAQRVLFEGNLLENTWGGFSQAGFAIVLTPVNQGGKCPECRVMDVTLRYNRITNTGGGINIANVVGKTQTPSSGGGRYSIHDLVFDDMDRVSNKGFGLLVLLMSVAPPLSDIHFAHITAFPPRAVMSILNKGDALRNFSFTNSLVAAGEGSIVGAGGGPDNCIQGARDPIAALQHCFVDVVFKNNVIIGGRGTWPGGNHTVSDAKAAGLRDFREGRGGDYRLCPKAGKIASCKVSSPALSAGSEGKDVGADMDAIERATDGII